MCIFTPPLTLTPPLAQHGHKPHMSHEVMLLALPEPLYLKNALVCQNELYIPIWSFERFRKGGGAKILIKEIALLMMIWNTKWKYSCWKIIYSID